MTLESHLEGYFAEAVRKRLQGIAVKLIPMVAGMPDRMVLLPGGKCLLVELKTTSGRLSAIQQHRHTVLATLGHPVTVLAGRHAIDEWIRMLLDLEFDEHVKAQRTAAKQARGK